MANTLISDKTKLYLIPETTWDSTPLSGTTKNAVGWTEINFSDTANIIRSNVVRGDAQRKGIRVAGREIGNGYATEFTAGNNDAPVAALMLNTWQNFSVSPGASQVSVVAPTGGEFGYYQFASGTDISQLGRFMVMGVTGFQSGENNGAKTITKIEGQNVFVEEDVVAESTVANTQFSVSYLVNGSGTTSPSFTAEIVMEDTGNAGSIDTITGWKPMEGSWTIEPGTQVTQNFTGIGGNKTGIDSTNLSGDQSRLTVVPVSSAPMMQGNDDIHYVAIDGSDRFEAARSFNLTINNNMRRLPVLGRATTINPKNGIVDVSVNVNLFYQNNVLYNKYINGEPLEIGSAISDPRGNKYSFYMPNAVITTRGKTLAGESTDIDETLDLEGTAPTDKDFTLRICRYLAP